MQESTLVERVLALTDAAGEDLTGPAAASLDAIRSRLREPLRVAVAGRVKAGKSTLVNALLGQRVAPTDVSECTKVVTWFRYGAPERVCLHLRDGELRELQLERSGMLPKNLGVDPGRVKALDVWLSNDLLRAMTLIDTPGLSSANAELSAATQELLTVDQDSADATAAAEAVAFVLNQNVRADELEILRAFRARSTELRGSAVNAVGVLSKADKVGGGGPDAWRSACEMAARQADRFRAEVATVVPVVGLLGETAATAALTEADVTALTELASLDPDGRTSMLWSAERFVAFDSPVPPPLRRRLLSLLDLYGLERAFAAIRAGARGASELRAELESLSGMAPLREVLVENFRRRADALKARTALNALERLSYASGGNTSLRRLRDDVEVLRLDPAAHDLALLEALHACLTKEVTLPAELVSEVVRMASGGRLTTRLAADVDGPADLIAAVQAGVARWKGFAMNAAPKQAHVARVMTRSYELAWDALEAGEPVR